MHEAQPVGVDQTAPGRRQRRSVLPRRRAVAGGSDGGQALPLALLTLAVGVLIVSMLAMAAGVYVRLSSAAASDLLDYYAADAGVELALATLATAGAQTGSASHALTLNNRPVSVSVSALGSQTQPDPASGLPATATTYLITSRAGDLVITARAEARQVAGQPAAVVRVTAWRVGQ